mgnify:CR=1 FL=1
MEKQISITKIKIRHSQILLFLNCPKKPETLQGELRFQNAWLNFCHPVAFYPVGKVWFVQSTQINLKTMMVTGS